jgi:MoxR-like ATPase
VGTRQQLAARRFAGFFQELREVFVERDDVLRQIALALLAREHVLLTGPPGTAKSNLAAAVLGRIVDDHSLRPSVFARQFTESTVQTDLVGPINFKTLTETGRTQHFTDEGILGEVHAFLDEVLDGRDMLLRSTLNLLQEREIKEGTTITRGRIECALMTTNRYLAEVIEQSRETLLAFVDRIAFLSFVPKGFAEPNGLTRVLREQVGGAGKPVLRAFLTIQDVDALQELVDTVTVPDYMCQRLGTLLSNLEAEQEAASRADPMYVPTRYISTRTAVRLGNLLRAICVLDWLTNHPGRALEAGLADLEWLRLAVLLSGPNRKDVDTLITRESDPRERRQLEIIALERDMFDRCLAALPPAPPEKARAASVHGPLSDDVEPAPESTSVAELLERTKQIAAKGGDRAEQQRELETNVRQLVTDALLDGLALGSSRDEDPLSIVKALADVADDLEHLDGTQRSVARWLRGRAVTLLRGCARLSPVDVATTARSAAEPPHTLELLLEHAIRRLSRAEELVTLRERLHAGAAEDDSPEETKQAFEHALQCAEEDVAWLWDDGFRGAVGSAFERASSTELAPALEALKPVFEAIDSTAARLSAIGAPSRLKARVVGPRLSPLVAATFERFSAKDRLAVAADVGHVLEILAQAGLSGAIAPLDLLRWSAEALLRSDKGKGRAAEPGGDHVERYRAVRSARERVSNGFVLCDIGLRLVPRDGKEVLSLPSDVGALVGSLPEKLTTRLAEEDLARIEAPLGVLEGWFESVRDVLQKNPDAALSSSVVRDFFQVVGVEMALARFDLELGLVATLFEQARPGVARVRERLSALSQGTRDIANGLLDERSRQAWQATWARHAGSP